MPAELYGQAAIDLGVSGEKRRRGHSFAEQLGRGFGKFLIEAGDAGADLLPGVLQVYANAANTGAINQETAQLVTVCKVGHRAHTVRRAAIKG
jgi:hypothetical protein